MKSWYLTKLKNPIKGRIKIPNEDSISAVCYHKIRNVLERVTAKLSREFFIGWELVLSRICQKRKMRILFSSMPAWESNIKKGFRFTQHEVVFGEMSLLKTKRYDLVVPLKISDLQYLNSERHLIASNPIPIPSTSAVDLCNDKFLLNQALIRNGFGEFVPEMGNVQEYPYILKKRNDDWGKNSHIISTSEQEQNYANILTDPGYFHQEFIRGPYLHAAHILFKDQRIIRMINIRHFFSTELFIQGKSRGCGFRICRCPYSDLFASILVSIGFDGLCCIDYKVFDDRPYILEINPRFGGSLAVFFFSYLRSLE